MKIPGLLRPRRLMVSGGPEFETSRGNYPGVADSLVVNPADELEFNLPASWRLGRSVLSKLRRVSIAAAPGCLFCFGNTNKCKWRS